MSWVIGGDTIFSPIGEPVVSNFDKVKAAQAVLRAWVRVQSGDDPVEAFQSELDAQPESVRWHMGIMIEQYVPDGKDKDEIFKSF